MKCRLCHHETKRFLSLGSCPSPNRLLTKEQLGRDERRYPMDLTFCENCRVVQSEATIPPEDIFTDYPYASSTSAATRRHFESLAKSLAADEAPGSLVIEIASNDGVLQRPLREMGIHCIGVEPARNICELAWQDGLDTRNEFFTEKTVDRLGPHSADVVIACNVFAHVPDLRAFTRAVKRLLKDSGQVILEVEYLGDIIDQVAYGNFYQDHLFYWSLSALRRFLSSEGLYVHTALRVATQGGSIRVHANKRSGVLAEGVLIARGETSWNLQTYQDFAQKVAMAQHQFRSTLQELKEAGACIAGYGAAAKGLSLLNYCNIGPDIISYIVDDSPLKQGRWSPGSHIPIISPKQAEGTPPDYLVLLAWNFAEQLMEQSRHLGAQYILPVPPRVVNT